MTTSTYQTRIADIKKHIINFDCPEGLADCMEFINYIEKSNNKLQKLNKLKDLLGSYEYSGDEKIIFRRI